MKNIILVVVIVVLFTAATFFRIESWQASNGDVNHDGKVNSLDISVVLNHWSK